MCLQQNERTFDKYSNFIIIKYILLRVFLARNIFREIYVQFLAECGSLRPEYVTEYFVIIQFIYI
jgi:hypothetical protein